MPAEDIVPSWFDDRDISHPEVVKMTELPIATIYNYARLLRASGAEFGAQFRGDWFYSTRELCAFSMATALKRLGYPVGLVVLQDILRFVRENDIPSRPFTIGFKGLPAVVL